MSHITRLMLLPLLVVYTISSTSCNRTYQCVCPAFTAGANPYTFEVEAKSSKAAKKKCVKAGENDPVVDDKDAKDCRVL